MDEKRSAPMQMVDAYCATSTQVKSKHIPHPSININPNHIEPEATKLGLHPSLYVAIWIFLSSSTILSNKWILGTLGFGFPIFLTTWHLVFATIATRVLAHTTSLLDGRKNINMTAAVYLRAIVPIGVFFSLSLIFSNQALMFLTVAFIQMLKAITPVTVLLATWALCLEKPDAQVLGNVAVIVFGVMIASYCEVTLDIKGLMFQLTAIVCESVRLVMVQRLLSSTEFKMDPLVSLYYFAPVCAVMNFMVFMLCEYRWWKIEYVMGIGPMVLLANAMVAFALNVSVVFLIGKTSSLVLTLCGILKDILLVFISVFIWSTPVMTLQVMGYSISIIGLAMYKLGVDRVREAYARLRVEVLKYSRKYPIIYRALVTVLFIGVLLMSMTGLYAKYKLYRTHGPLIKAAAVGTVGEIRLGRQGWHD